MKKLIQLYSIILRAVSCAQKINVPKLKNLIKEFSLILANNAKWVDYSMTVHGLIFHAPDLIDRNDGIELGQLSEEA